MVKKITKNNILKLFLDDYNKSFYLRELAKLLSKPHQTIKPKLDELYNDNILLKKRRGKILEFSLNTKNKILIEHLSIAEKEVLIDKLNSDALIKVLYEKIERYFNESSFIIFGSATIKNDYEDIDLICIGKSKIEKDIKDFEDTYSKKIHFIKIDSIEKIKKALREEIYKKHIILNDTEKILRKFKDERYKLVF